jgi:dTDP-4-dehydrorhamnose reductase
MRVLILGGTGMLGHKLCQRFRDRFDTWVTTRGSLDYPVHEAIFPEHVICKVDVSNFDDVIKAMALAEPHIVVNCVGVIKQLLSDPMTFISINSLYPHKLANLCRACDARLIHISTDCVFSGEKGWYNESDKTDATDLYGMTKRLGEVPAPALTLRTSIIGPELNTKNGLLEWFLSQSKCKGFERAIFTGFTTRALSDIIAGVIEYHPQLSGIWHVSSDPISKANLLRLIKRVYNLDTDIEPDESFVCDRSLDSKKFRNEVGFEPKSWQQMIEEMHWDAV